MFFERFVKLKQEKNGTDWDSPFARPLSSQIGGEIGVNRKKGRFDFSVHIAVGACNQTETGEGKRNQ